MPVHIKPIIIAIALAATMAACGNRQDNSVTPAHTSVGTEIDDTVVTTRIKTALFNDMEIKSFDLKVETRKGVAQLSGFVDNQSQVDRAIATTRAVEGVKSVDNSISLKIGTATIGNTVDDGIITTRVKSALLAAPTVKSFDIAVVTSKGRVQLSGFVDNAGQIDEANAIARRVDGVTSIGNELKIKK